MAHKEVEDAVEKLLEPILEADGIEVVDVESVSYTHLTLPTT